MEKIIGWIVTVIGAIVTFVNVQTYTSKSSEIQAWYYYEAELESARTFMIVGGVLLIIGVMILLFAYKRKDN